MFVASSCDLIYCVLYFLQAMFCLSFQLPSECLKDETEDHIQSVDC